MGNGRPILLVDDDKIDDMTTKRVFRDIHVHNPVDVAGNGEEALEHLRANRENLPCIILLDINMPRMNGIEFLRIIKGDRDLKRISGLRTTVPVLRRNTTIKSFRYFKPSRHGMILKVPG
jgi:CheY-like chemotaxis protein